MVIVLFSHVVLEPPSSPELQWAWHLAKAEANSHGIDDVLKSGLRRVSQSNYEICEEASLRCESKQKIKEALR